VGVINRMLAGALRAAFDGALEKRSSLENPQTPLNFPAEWLLDIFNGGRTDSGMRVSEITALQVSTVYACVNLISDGV
jgi:phage portal protein BeeE